MKKFFKSILYIFFILLLEISTLSLLFLIPLSRTVNKETIKEIILNLNSIQEISPIYNGMNTSEINDETITKIMESEKIKELTAEISSSITDYILTGKKQDFITKEELKMYVKEAIAIVNKEADQKITEEEQKNILELIDQNAENYLNELIKINTLDVTMTKEEMDGIYLLRFLLSTQLKIYFTIAIFLALISIIILKWEKKKWVKSIAITTLVATVLSFIIYLLLHLINTVLFKEEIVYVYHLFTKMIHQGFILTFTIFVVMIILLILYKFVIQKEKNLTSISNEG